MASDVDIILEVAVNGVGDIFKLSNAMQQLNRAVSGATNPMRNLDARSRALSRAVGSADSSLKNHAKTISQLATNHAVLSNELAKIQKEINGLGTSFKFARGSSSEFRKAAIADLKAYESALSKVKTRALIEDLRSISQEQKRLGKDAQFVGRSLIIGITTPMMVFGRMGLQSLVAMDKELVRLNKVLEGVAPNIDSAAKKMGVDLPNATAAQTAQLNKMVVEFNNLEKALVKVSTRFGLPKSLAVGLAGEFAELGIQTTENIALITELTAATEKLGNMDIANAKELVQSLYFQAQRAMQQSGEANRLTFQEREIAAIKAATAQLNMFNAVENVTALTLKDLGDAFPEVAAAGSSFGLSMTELAAMLAPMKAAGFEVGASANSIKVSLQRLTAPTKQNAEMFKKLSKEYNTNFNEVKGIGLDAIQQLIDGFNELRDSAAGQEGAMEFFAKVFGVRQGPRMEVSIAQLAAFDKILKNVNADTDSAEKRLQGFANTAIEGLNRTQNAGLPVIDSFKDIGIIARIATTRIESGQKGIVDGFGEVTEAQVKAAREVRKAVSEEIFKAQQASGEDLIGQVGTEAGRAMFIQLAGSANAAQVAQRELEAALGALDVKLAVLKNNFKMFASDLLKAIGPAIEKISDLSTELYTRWSNLSPQLKRTISVISLVIATLVASIGPLIFIFGQFRLAIGSVSKVLLGFLPGLNKMSIDMVAARYKMLNLTKPLVAMGDTVVNTNSKFATLLATVASGESRFAKLAERIGIATGKLQKQTTAQMALTRQVMSQVPTRPGYDPITGATTIGPTGKKPLGTLVRTRAGIIDPDDPRAIVPSALRKAFAEEEFSMEQRGLRRSGASGTRYNIAQGTGFLRRGVGFRSISAADVGAAIDIRQKAFEQAGIVRTSPSASLGGGRLLRRGREISEDRALRIARGGVRGRALAAVDTATAVSSQALNKSLTAIKGAPTAAVGSYRKALAGARTAQKLLMIETLAFTGTGPSAFARMRAAVAGFAKSFTLVNKAIKLTKILLITSGIGIIFLAIGVAVMLVMKNMEKFKEVGKNAMDGIGKVVSTLKETFMALIQPILDLFASFGSGADGAGGAISGVANAFNLIVKAVQFVADIFKFFVVEIVQPYLYIIVNIVKFVVNLFQGKWSDALKALGAAFGTAFSFIAKIVLEIMGFLLKQVVNIIFELPAAFAKAWAWGIEKATDLFFSFQQFIIDQVSKIPVLGKFLGGVGQGVLNTAKSARDLYVGTIRRVADATNSAGDAIKRGIDGMVDSAVGATEKLTKGGVQRGKGRLPGKKNKEETELDVDTENAQEQISNATGEGMSEGAEEGAKEMARKAAQALRDIKKEVQQEIADRIKDQINSIVETLRQSLVDQKEASLAVYDAQIDKIDEVAKAEERLTKEQEYQNRLREAEEQRVLNRINNRRNYLLAIYSGQIDEARAIADEGARQEISDNKNILEIQENRAKEVAEQNRKDMIDSIKAAKSAAQEYFDDMIKNFTESAKKITEFPPTTAEEFNNQLNSLVNIAKDAANNIGTNFSDSFSGVLGNLGVNATGPLTSSLQAISETLVKNNPFGTDGVWNKTIDEAISGLTKKYQGLINVITMVIDEKSSGFNNLFEIYKKYKALIDEGESGGVGTGGGAGGGVGGGTGGGGTGSGNTTETLVAGYSRQKINSYIATYLNETFGGDSASRQIPSAVRSLVTDVVNSALILGDYGQARRELNQSISRNRYPEAVRSSSQFVYNYIMKNRSSFKGRENGGPIPYAQGGPTVGPVQQAIPAILHGGEYVVRNSAVKKYGWGMMDQINQGTYKPKQYFIGGLIDDIKKKLGKMIMRGGKNIKQYENFMATPDSELSRPYRNLKTGINAFKPAMDFLTPTGSVYFGTQDLGTDNVYLNSLIAATAMFPTSSIFSPASDAIKTASKTPKVVKGIKNAIKKIKNKIPKIGGNVVQDIPPNILRPDLPPVPPPPPPPPIPGSLRAIIANTRERVNESLPVRIYQGIKSKIPAEISAIKSIFEPKEGRRIGFSPRRAGEKQFDFYDANAFYNSISPFESDMVDRYPSLISKMLGKFYYHTKTLPMDKLKISKIFNPFNSSIFQNILKKLNPLENAIGGDNPFVNYSFMRPNLGVDEEYRLAFARYKFQKDLQDQFNNILQGTKPSTRQYIGTLSSKQIRRILKDDFNILTNITGRNYTVKIVRPSKQSGLYDTTAAFSFEVGQHANAITGSVDDQLQTLKIESLYSGQNIRAQSDVIKLLAYVYDQIIKPQGVSQVVNQSYSKYSYLMSLKFGEMMKAIDPDLYVHTPNIYDWARLHKNDITFDTSRAVLHPISDMMMDLDYYKVLPFNDSIKLDIASMQAKMVDAMKDLKNTRGKFKTADELELEATLFLGLQDAIDTYNNLLATFSYRLPRVLDSSDIVAWNSYYQGMFETLGRAMENIDYNRFRMMQGRFNGGMIPRRYNGGIIPGFESQGVPALLHGGEFVVNAKAVKNIGFAALQAMNNMRFQTPKSPSYQPSTGQQVNSTSTVHIYVDNFIGEKAWFESMMKDYNIKVAPQNQKNAGLNNTTISTYSGINRGM